MKQPAAKTGAGSNSPAGSNAATTSNAVPNPQLAQTVRDAFVYALPLVLMDITRRQATNADPHNSMVAAPNTFRHLSSFPDATFKQVVRPNADTFYSSAWLDLTKEPVVLSLPDTNGRYYMMPMLDAYTNIFASPGTRTTGNGAGNFVVTGPGWTRDIPDGMKEIKAPSNMVWIIGRTQVNSKEDGKNVVIPLQQQYKLTPLSAWGSSYTAPAPKLDPFVPKGDPNSVVRNMNVAEFFNYANLLMGEYPPPLDTQVMDRFASAGIGEGLNFDMSQFNVADRNAIEQVPKEVFAEFEKQLSAPDGLENGWAIHRKDMGTYGTNYAQRALVAYMGLGANLPEDAIYPSTQQDADGNKLNGASKYVLHFDKGQTPPAGAFWSLTMYSPEGYMVDNPINRYTIGDRSNLVTNPDGSVDIFIQSTSPGNDKEANWLPAPDGDFNILMRVYRPNKEMIDGSWKIPAIGKA